MKIISHIVSENYCPHCKAITANIKIIGDNVYFCQSCGHEWQEQDNKPVETKENKEKERKD